MRWQIVLMVFWITFMSKGQSTSILDTVGQNGKFENIYSLRLNGDSLSTAFCIVIKQAVKPHKHLKHSEQVIVLEGQGEMMLGKELFVIHKGDLVFIPKNTVHSVISKGSVPLKVLSIQSPAFDGSDRVMVEPH